MCLLEGTRTILRRYTLKKDKPTAIEESNIIALCKEGDHRAFQQLYQRYRKLIMKIAYSMVRNLEAAQDVMHDVFVKVLTHVKTFDEKCTFSTWLWMLTKNTCIDRIRKDRRAASTEYFDTRMHDETRQDIRMHADIPTPDAVYLHQEYCTQFTRALNTLPPRNRVVFEMRELRGMSYEEIATSLGCPLGTVTSRLFYARKDMEKKLAHYDRS